MMGYVSDLLHRSEPLYKSKETKIQNDDLQSFLLYLLGFIFFIFGFAWEVITGL